MDFEIYRNKVEELLTRKAANNLKGEATIQWKEVDLSIKATDDLTALFQDWLSGLDIVKSTSCLGKGLISCVIRKEQNK